MKLEQMVTSDENQTTTGRYSFIALPIAGLRSGPIRKKNKAAYKKGDAGGDEGHRLHCET